MRTFAQKAKASQQTTSTKSAKPSRPFFGQSREVNSIFHLQRTIGNQAVQRLLEINTWDVQENSTATPIARFGHDFSRIPIHPPSARPIQTKLAINKPGNEFEQEADRVAEQVMCMSESSAQPPGQREGEVALVHTKPVTEPPSYIGQQAEEEEEVELIQAKEATDHSPEVDQNTQAQFETMRGGGQPLQKSVLDFFEPRFGYDFSRVRVHTDEETDDSARGINARAYTVGHDIVFGAGEYAPETNTGKLLLAHELAHVIQQSSPEPVSPPIIMRSPKGKVVGWLIKVGERKLIKRAAIYSENELTKLLAKGYSVLVKQGSAQAKRIAKKVWGENFIHHTGHIIRKTGKQGLSHFQPARRLMGKAGEKGWHIFYSAIPILFFSEDVEAMEVYEDKYPGKSVANYLTVTQYAGEDSWLSYLDWINPLELIAIGGDIGRDLDRERTKELKAIVVNRVTDDGTVQTYELDPEGELIRVIVVKPDGKQKILSADEYYTFLGKQTEEPVLAPAAQEGTKHPLYASTFDADYRIYISNKMAGGWKWDKNTLSFYLPAEYAKKLQKIGEFYVMENLSIKYVYAYVHPRHRAVLNQPGFLVPEDLVRDYKSSPKEEFLQKLLNSALQSAKVKKADLWQAK